MKWTGNKEELLVFLKNLNIKHRAIKFEQNISHSNISFLETLIYKDKNNTLQTTLYQNPVIINNISMHIQTIQSHLKKGIPYSQAFSIKTMCFKLT